VVLAPRRGVILIPVIEKGVNHLSMSQFLEEIKEEGIVYALMTCEKVSRVDNDVSVELQEVLTEFAESTLCWGQACRINRLIASV
jgi:hypothetical protein